MKKNPSANQPKTSQAFQQYMVKWRVGAHGCAPLLSAPTQICILLISLLFAAIMPLQAQEATPSGVTYDDVNRIASKMYCPECENIPLDKCGTAVCIQWKSEIADQIAAGRSEQEIVDGFVARFGDQILGIPQDPTLRSIALIAPYILAGLALLVGVITFWRWRNHQVQPVTTLPAIQPAEEADYRSRIERDLDL